MLSFTGAWISFPQFFGRLSGTAEQRAPAAPAAARPVAEPIQSPNEAAGIARAHSEGRLLAVTWPTERDGKWKVSYQRDGGNAEVGVDDATRKVTPPKPPRAEPIARTMRRWHDGTGMGAVWQAIIFLGGIAQAMRR